MEGPEAFARPALRPIIKELVRTKVCFPKIQLLVDRILLATVAEQEDGRLKEAFRLYLSDGEKSIQALVRRRLYKMITAGDVWRGIVLVDQGVHIGKCREDARRWQDHLHSPTRLLSYRLRRKIFSR